jgi:hypothetical protein
MKSSGKNSKGGRKRAAIKRAVTKKAAPTGRKRAAIKRAVGKKAAPKKNAFKKSINRGDPPGL